MTVGTDWHNSAPVLRESQLAIDIGLHLTFTECPPLGAMPRLAPGGILPTIGQLMQSAITGQLPYDEILAEARRQIAAFTDAMGHPPSHIDGHQHVHCFPVIREATLTLAQEYGCYVRHCATNFAAFQAGLAQPSKALAINLLGAGFAARLRQANIRHNHAFFGLHDFNPNRSLFDLYTRWLKPPLNRPNDLLIINCHPAQGQMPGDPLAVWRETEYAFLAGTSFTTILKSHSLQPGRMTQV